MLVIRWKSLWQLNNNVVQFKDINSILFVLCGNTWLFRTRKIAFFHTLRSLEVCCVPPCLFFLRYTWPFHLRSVCRKSCECYMGIMLETVDPSHFFFFNFIVIYFLGKTFPELPMKEYFDHMLSILLIRLVRFSHLVLPIST